MIFDFLDELQMSVGASSNEKLSLKEVEQKVSQYFEGIVWSLEKEEWLKMTTKQRNEFIRRFRSYLYE